MKTELLDQVYNRSLSVELMGLPLSPLARVHKGAEHRGAAEDDRALKEVRACTSPHLQISFATERLRINLISDDNEITSSPLASNIAISTFIHFKVSNLKTRSRF
jgi:hypothetical protein